MFFAAALRSLYKPQFGNEAVTIAGSRVIAEILREHTILSTETLWKHAEMRGVSSMSRMELTLKWMEDNKQIRTLSASSIGFPGVSKLHMLADEPQQQWKTVETHEERVIAKARRVNMRRKKHPIPPPFFDWVSLVSDSFVMFATAVRWLAKFHRPRCDMSDAEVLAKPLTEMLREHKALTAKDLWTHAQQTQGVRSKRHMKMLLHWMKSRQMVRTVLPILFNRGGKSYLYVLPDEPIPPHPAPPKTPPKVKKKPKLKRRTLQRISLWDNSVVDST